MRRIVRTALAGAPHAAGAGGNALGVQQLPIPADRSIFSSDDARAHERASQEAVEQETPKLQDVGSDQAKIIPKSVGVWRKTKKQWLKNGAGELSALRARTPHDNSMAPNRVNGSRDGVKSGKPAFYLTKEGKNGLPGDNAPEAALYSHFKNEKAHMAVVNAVTRVQEGKGSPGDLALIQQWYAPETLFPTPEDVMVRYKLHPRGRPIIDFADPATLEAMEEPTRRARIELLLAYKREMESNPRISERLPHNVLNEVVTKKEGEPISMAAALLGSSYAMSQAVGNILLAGGIGIAYPSARRDSVLIPAYTDGSFNLALPCRPGEPMEGLEPVSTRYFNPEMRKFDREDFGDGTGNL
jgi:hypothetical protein